MVRHTQRQHHSDSRQRPVSVWWAPCDERYVVYGTTQTKTVFQWLTTETSFCVMGTMWCKICIGYDKGKQYPSDRNQWPVSVLRAPCDERSELDGTTQPSTVFQWLTSVASFCMMGTMWWKICIGWYDTHKDSITETEVGDQFLYDVRHVMKDLD